MINPRVRGGGVHDADNTVAAAFLISGKDVIAAVAQRRGKKVADILPKTDAAPAKVEDAPAETAVA